MKTLSNAQRNSIKIYVVLTILLFAYLMCGCAGRDGANGLDGAQGNSSGARIYNASSYECPNGGVHVDVVSIIAPKQPGETPTYLIMNSFHVCNGAPGPQGDTGDQGPVGTPGSIGSNGSNGTNATPVGVVQFCPGQSNYPSTFPEVGLIIGGKVYGVYSTNGGFMAYLPPGAYTSNGVGSACNFTINADTTIMSN